MEFTICIFLLDLFYSCYGVALVFDRGFQQVVCYCGVKGYDSGAAFVADFGGIYLLEGFEALFDPAGAVGAHHALDLHCFFHSLISFVFCRSDDDLGGFV